MKFFSLIMLMSSMLVVNYSYASENNELKRRAVSFGDEYDGGTLVKEFKDKEIENISLKKFNGDDKEVIKQFKKEPTGPYNDLIFDDFDDNDKESADVAMTCESWCCATITSALVMSFIFSKQVGEVLLDKKNN